MNFSKRTCAMLVSALLLSACLCGAGEPARRELPAPNTTGGPALAQTLAERQTGRDFADVDLTPRQLSDLLWSVAGANRPDGKTTYPVARNRHDMAVYVFLRKRRSKPAWCIECKSHQLKA